MQTKVIVGYTTRIRETKLNLIPDIQPAESCTTEKGKSENVERRMKKFLENQKNMIYNGELEAVTLVIPARREIMKFEQGKDTYRLLTGKKKVKAGTVLPMPVQIRNYLLNTFPKAWPEDMKQRETEVRFLGFEPRGFLKMLGADCAMLRQPCPESLCSANSDHRDLLTAIVPAEYQSQGQTLEVALMALGIETPEMYSPGDDAILDAQVSLLIADAYGFLVGDEGSVEGLVGELTPPLEEPPTEEQPTEEPVAEAPAPVEEPAAT